MKGIRIFLIAVAGTAFTTTLAFANPGMLPAHAGYPMSATKSPADGTRTSHDAGQANAVGSQAAMEGSSYHDAQSMNEVTDPNRMRIKKSGGAGRLPEVEGALNRVDVNPGGATSTVIQ